MAIGLTGLLAASLLLVAATKSTNLDSLDPSTKEAMKRLLDAGIITGDGTGNLNLDQDMTRASFAKMITEAFGIDPETTKTSSFSDVSGNYWGVGYIEAARKMALANGFELGLGNGKFDPNKPLTTIESLVFIEKFLAVDVDKGTAANSNWITDAINAAIKSGLIKVDQSKFYSNKDNATREFVFKLSDYAFSQYELPTGETIYEKFHSESVAEEVYSEDGAGLAP